MKFKSLESNIYSVFTIMIFLQILIIQVFAFYFIQDSVRLSVLKNNEVLLSQLVRQIDTYLHDMEYLINSIVNDDDVHQALSGTSPPMVKKRVRDKLSNYLLARDDLSGIYLFDNQRHLFSSSETDSINPSTNLDDKDWYQLAIHNPENNIISTTYVQNIIKDKYSWVVSISREIVTQGRHIGVVLVDLKFKEIDQLIRSLIIGNKSYNFIIDFSGNIIFHPRQQLVYSNLLYEPIDELVSEGFAEDGTYTFDQKTYFREKTIDADWYVINATHSHDINLNLGQLQLTYMLVSLGLFILTGIATKRISREITRPLKKLQTTMQQVDRGEFRIIENLEGGEEIQELGRDYNIMVTRIRELMVAIVNEQEQKRNSELTALQAQINPHFLYNTLDSLIWMGEMGQNRKVVEMTSALSKLLRMSIGKGSDLILIREELAHVRAYLIIQQMRYGNKFSYTIDISEEILDFMILKITLQPLVENAIYHGIRNLEEHGSISIRGSVEDETIQIIISDNGKLLTQTRFSQVFQETHDTQEGCQSKTRQSHGVGLRNVHKRIQLYFGSDYGITCATEPGMETQVIINIPMVPRDNR